MRGESRFARDRSRRARVRPFAPEFHAEAQRNAEARRTAFLVEMLTLPHGSSLRTTPTEDLWGRHRAVIGAAAFQSPRRLRGPSAPLPETRRARSSALSCAQPVRKANTVTSHVPRSVRVAHLAPARAVTPPHTTRHNLTPPSTASRRPPPIGTGALRSPVLRCRRTRSTVQARRRRRSPPRPRAPPSRRHVPTRARGACSSPARSNTCSTP